MAGIQERFVGGTDYILSAIPQSISLLEVASLDDFVPIATGFCTHFPEAGDVLYA